MVAIELPRDRVARELRARVEANEWAPGERLPAYDALAASLGTSKATLSHAVQRLVDEGLLVVLPNYGTFRNDNS